MGQHQVRSVHEVLVLRPQLAVGGAVQRMQARPGYERAALAVVPHIEAGPVRPILQPRTALLPLVYAARQIQRWLAAPPPPPPPPPRNNTPVAQHAPCGTEQAGTDRTCSESRQNCRLNRATPMAAGGEYPRGPVSQTPLADTTFPSRTCVTAPVIVGREGEGVRVRAWDRGGWGVGGGGGRGGGGGARWGGGRGGSGARTRAQPQATAARCTCRSKTNSSPPSSWSGSTTSATVKKRTPACPPLPARTLSSGALASLARGGGAGLSQAAGMLPQTVPGAGRAAAHAVTGAMQGRAARHHIRMATPHPDGAPPRRLSGTGTSRSCGQGSGMEWNGIDEENESMSGLEP